MRSILRVELLEDRRLPTLVPIYLPVLQPEVEPNDTVEQANAVKLVPLYPYWAETVATTRIASPWLGTSFSASVTGDFAANVAGGDVDYFSFTVASERLITLTLTGKAVEDGVTPVLLDAKGNAVASTLTTETDHVSVSFYSREGGTFLAQLGPDGKGTADYALRIDAAADPYNEHEPNNTLAQANALDLIRYPIYYLRAADYMPDFVGIRYPGPWWDDRQYANVNGNLDKSTTDVDYFSFKAEAGRLITVSLDGEAVGNGAIAQLLDADGKVLATVATPAVDYATVSFYSRAGGSFFVRVGSAEGATTPVGGAYGLQVTVATDRTNEHEPNDSPDEANAIDLASGYPWFVPLESFAPATDSLTIIAPLPWKSGHGYIAGDLTAHAADQDYFSFRVGSNHTIKISLTGTLAGGRITLYDAKQNEIAQDADASDGLTIETTTTVDGTFYLRVDQGSAEAASGQYRVDVATAPVIDPVEGPDEHESNNTYDDANSIALDDTCDDENLSLRTGSALGIAGGPTGDLDNYQFAVQAGERVHVGIDGLVCEPDGDLYASVKAWRKAGGKRFVDLDHGPVQIAVFDADNNLIGTGTDDGTGTGGVNFDAPTDGIYYAVVTVTSGTDLVHYRVSIVATSQVDLEASELATNLVQIVKPGQSIDFVDASGDQVHLAYRGRGTAIVTFTGAQADGSDIASIVIDGGWRGGLIVQTEGSAEIGQITVNGAGRPFGFLRVDGDVGSLSSTAALAAINVKGTLGALHAPGKKIGLIKAYALDMALAEYAGSPKVKVQVDLNAAALQALNAAARPGR